MLKRICLAIVVASIAFPASAAPKCSPIDKSKVQDTVKFIKLTSGQTHFVQGAYTLVPPAGPPPGDGAMLVQQEKKSAIAFTSGKLVCLIIPVPENFVKALLKVGTGPLDKEGEEL